MNILVIGCGMIGTSLAETLDGMGHDVSVIDKSPEQLESLSAEFSGFTTVGVPIDQEVLKRAGITTCDALFAVTGEDDMNIMVAQIARQTFNVKKVYARVVDIKKGEVFEKLGISVLCPTKLTVTAACTALEADLVEEVAE